MPPILGAVAIMFLVVALAGGCGGGQESGSSQEEAAGQSVAEQETGPAGTESTGAEAKEDSDASIGEPVTLGSVQWTVTAAEQIDELVSRLGSEEGNFVIIDLTFANSSNQDVTLATPFFILLDSEGRKSEPDIKSNFTHLDPEKNFFVDPVEPGSTKEGRMIFAVEPDSSGFRLQVGEARFASGETGYIDLGF